MSILGTVYEINLKTRMKNLYPVVYENGKYYVCKVNGSSELKNFHKAEGAFSANWAVIPYSTFKKYWEDGKYKNWTNKIFVHVKHGEPAYFEAFMEQTAEEHRLEFLEKNINGAQNTLQRAISNHEFTKKCVEDAKERLEALEKERDSLEKIMRKKKLEKEN